MRVTINDKEYELPEIIFFKASAGTVRNKEPFSLQWEVKNATHVELCKNGVKFEKLNADITSRQISEVYDGKDKDIEYSLIASNDQGNTLSQTISVRLEGTAVPAWADETSVPTAVKETPMPAAGPPVIVFFRSSAMQAQSKTPFLLEWEVKNATQVDLYRNAIVFAKLSADKTSREITETYDGRDKEIVYTMIAINDAGQDESGPIKVRIINKVDRPEKPDPPKQPPTVPRKPANGGLQEYERRRGVNLKKIREYLWIVGGGIALALVLVFYLFTNKPRISGFDPKTIAEEHTVVITGKNFPKDSSQVQVLFNKVKGRIQYLSPELMRVNVPRLGDKFGDGNVTVSLVIKGDTSNESEKLVITKRESPFDILLPEVITGPAKDSPRVNESIPVKEKVSVVNTDPLPEAASNPRKKIDINPLVKASREFRRNAAGGTDLRITVQNDSPFDLDNVQVEVTYFRKNQSNIQKETIAFPNVRAHLEVSRDIPDGNPGTPVTFKIISIQSRQLDKQG